MWAFLSEFNGWRIYIYILTWKTWPSCSLFIRIYLYKLVLGVPLFRSLRNRLSWYWNGSCNPLTFRTLRASRSPCRKFCVLRFPPLRMVCSSKSVLISDTLPLGYGWHMNCKMTCVSTRSSVNGPVPCWFVHMISTSVWASFSQLLMKYSFGLRKEAVFNFL